MIYFVLCNEYIKIGITDNITGRMNILQTNSPYEIELLKIIRDGDKDYEERLHKQFAHLHQRGEWFKYEADLKEFIDLLPGECITAKNPDYVSGTTAATLLGITTYKLYKLDRDNILVPRRTIMDQRRYSRTQINEYMDKNKKDANDVK